MSLIEYPEAGYNSWISEDNADEFFETRLNCSEWDTCSKEISLMTSFRSLRELTLNIVFEDDQTISDTYTDSEKVEILKDLQQAQCEQTLHELKFDLDSQAISGFSLGGMLKVTIPKNQTPPPRYSERALSILRPYIVARSVTRTR